MRDDLTGLVRGRVLKGNPGNLKEYPGYVGVHTREQSPLAEIPNGATITKTVCKKGDSHEVGDCGVVLGSIGHEEVGVMYFVEWDDKPRVAVGVMGAKIKQVR